MITKTSLMVIIQTNAFNLHLLWFIISSQGCSKYVKTNLITSSMHNVCLFLALNPGGDTLADRWYKMKENKSFIILSCMHYAYLVAIL